MSVSLPHPEKIEKWPKKQVNFNVLKAKFGNGYGQYAANGLNAKKEKWSITWVNLTETEKDTIETALELNGGWGIFTWTPPNYLVEKKFRNEDDNYDTQQYGERFKISVTLTECFEVV
jgi:phage-related protein